MDIIKVKVFNAGGQQLPNYKTEGDSGMDLRADIPAPVVLHPMERKLIPSGIHVELPEGYEVQVRSRSGLSSKNGIMVVNGVGTVDNGYRGDIGACLINLSNVNFTINPGDRVAQIVFMPVSHAKWVEVENMSGLSNTERGDGGFGHTGKE
jgi:dUTP pyrophosphatase